MRCALAAAVVLPALALGLAPVEAAAPCRPAPASVRLSADHAGGGASLTGTVRLTCRRDHRTKLRLTGFAGVTVPDSVTVRAGRRSATFAVLTEAAAEARSGTVVASRRGSSASAPLTVDAVATTPVTPTVPVVPVTPTLPVVPVTPPPPVPPPLTGDGGLVSATVRESDRTRWSRQRVIDFVFDWPPNQSLADRTFLRMTSSAPEIIEPQFVDVERNPDYEYIAVTPPEVDTVVTLTFTLGDSSVTATTLASPLPTEVSGGLDVYWFSPAAHVVSGDEGELRAQIDVPAPNGTWVDLTSSHPQVWASRSMEFWTEDYWESTRGTFGPVSGPTTVTVTGTVRGTAITGSTTVLVEPDVASLVVPPTVTSGVLFTVRAVMRGPSSYERSLGVGGGLLNCTPDRVALPVGAAEASFTCVADPVGATTQVRLAVYDDGRQRGSATVTVVPRS